MSLSVVNWNVAWATPQSRHSPELLRRIVQHSPEIVCLTETDSGLLSPLNGHAISARPGWGQPVVNQRRKVLLWSKQQWTDVDDLGSDVLPPGRFIAGATETSVGRVAVIGVCIPYHNANVGVGVKTSGQWQDHAEYLGGLSGILKSKSPAPLIVMGDFNQQIGQWRNPYPPLSQPVRAGLQETMQAGGPPGLTIATAALDLRGRRAIDHIAISGDLSAESVATIDNRTDDSGKLSDHFGVVADLSVHHQPSKSSSAE